MKSGKKKIMKFILAAIYVSGILFATSCKKEEPCVQPEACTLSPDPGVCLAAIPRYYYDPQDGKCKEFTWGGCAGTVPFETLIACQGDCDCESE